MEQQKVLIDDISGILNKIKKDWDRVISNGHIISKIEKDILITDLKIAYELATELKVTSMASFYRQNNLHSSPEAGPESKELPYSYSLTDEELKPLPLQDNAEPVEPDNGNVSHSKPNKTIFDFDQQDARPESQKEETKTHPGQSKLMVDLFTAPKTVSDVLHGNGDNSLASKIQNNRISDIKAAIGINDKFTFINDIFKGEITKYNEGIEKLNNMEHYHEALDYIEQSGLATGTPENKAALGRLTDLIKRRYQS
ncbi:MAG: hypothetical protein IH598_11320 [Bacteroidales bacterium]|nr:hypothetical protein [Bacteroidales bacterium]